MKRKRYDIDSALAGDPKGAGWAGAAAGLAPKFSKTSPKDVDIPPRVLVISNLADRFLSKIGRRKPYSLDRSLKSE